MVGIIKVKNVIIVQYTKIKTYTQHYFQSVQGIFGEKIYLHQYLKKSVRRRPLNM